MDDRCGFLMGNIVLVRQTHSYLDVIWLLSEQSAIFLWAGCDELICIQSKSVCLYENIYFTIHYFPKRDEGHNNGQDCHTEM